MFVSIAELKHSSKVVKAAQGQPIIITKHGKPYAIMVRSSQDTITDQLKDLSNLYKLLKD